MLKVSYKPQTIFISLRTLLASKWVWDLKVRTYSDYSLCLSISWNFRLLSFHCQSFSFYYYFWFVKCKATNFMVYFIWGICFINRSVEILSISLSLDLGMLVALFSSQVLVFESKSFVLLKTILDGIEWGRRIDCWGFIADTMVLGLRLCCSCWFCFGKTFEVAS